MTLLGSARLRSRVFVDARDDRAIRVARSQQRRGLKLATEPPEIARQVVAARRRAALSIQASRVVEGPLAAGAVDARQARRRADDRALDQPLAGAGCLDPPAIALLIAIGTRVSPPASLPVPGDHRGDLQAAGELGEAPDLGRARVPGRPAHRARRSTARRGSASRHRRPVRPIDAIADAARVASRPCSARNSLAASAPRSRLFVSGPSPAKRSGASGPRRIAHVSRSAPTVLHRTLSN